MVDLGRDQDGDPITSCVIKFIPIQGGVTSVSPWDIVKELKLALDAALRQAGHQIQPSPPNGPLIDAAPLSEVRQQFYAVYPTKTPDAKKKALQRQRKKVDNKNLIGTSLVNGVEYMWIR